MSGTSNRGGGMDLEGAARDFGPASRWADISKGLGDVRVVYTDLDGTMFGPNGCFFLNGQREYTLRPARALIETLKRGVDVVPVSGRSGRQLRENVRIMGLSNYIAELGVELVYNQGERMVINTGDFRGESGDLYRSIMCSGAVDFLLTRYPRRIEFHTPWSQFRD